MSSTDNPNSEGNDRIITSDRGREATVKHLKPRNAGSKLRVVGSALRRSLLARTVLALAEHTVATGFSALCFWITGLMIKYLLHEGWIQKTIDTIEGIGLIILVLWLFIQMFRQLYNAAKEISNGSHPILVV